MKLALTNCEVRSWDEGDAPSVARLAANPKVAGQMRDGFAVLGRLEGAQSFISRARARQPETFFAIAVNGEAVGGIGFSLHDDVERVSAEIAYWLGEPFWGRGIASEALAAVTRLAIEQHGLTRVWAVPFATNPASCRILEKCGYQLEGRMRRSAIKNGEAVDQLLYAFVPQSSGY